MFGRKKEPEALAPVDSGSDQQQHVDQLHDTGKSTWERLWPVLACGAGLFSDGYTNNVIGSVSAVLGSAKLYGKAYTNSPAKANVSSIAFAGTVAGMLIFGYTSDKWSRKNSLLVSTIFLALFTALAAGSYGYKGSIQGMFAALTAWRFLVGVGIGGEYPAGSVACSESTGELKSGTRNRWFIMFTNVMIDWGFVFGALVPYVVVVATTENHLRAAWRIMLGIGCICPLALLFLRFKLKEPEEFRKESMKHVKIPYKLVMKFYWFRLLIVSSIWFLYNFSSYSFGIYSNTILGNILGKDAPLRESFGWNVVINLFYIPGAMFGSVLSDWIGPRYALALGVSIQAVVGFLMAGLYPTLSKVENVAGFVVVYGIFLSLGEMGPGDNIGLLASKTCATGVRGQYYAFAAAVGKIGAFIGTYVFPEIQKIGGGGSAATAQYPFYLSSALCVVTGLLAVFGLPNVAQDTITQEDIKFRAYLEANGWDTSQLGLNKGEHVESSSAIHDENKQTVRADSEKI